jgi:nucleoside-diphosphate-sugar epimerase
MPDRTCVVTGATGFLGRNLCERVAEDGWEVRGLARDTTGSPFSRPGITLFECDLPDRIDEAAFRGADVVVHCAYMSRHTTLAEARRVNEEGTARVLALTRAAGARFVFISSTGAHEDSLSYYGRSKLAIEGRLDLERDLVIRPGLILGDGGLFQRISQSLARFGFVPVFDGGHQRIQTVHVADLCEAIVRAVDRGLTGRYVVAEPEGLELRELFHAIAARMGRRARLVPLPAAPLLVALRTAEAIGLRLPLTSENVLGARSLRTQPSEADLARIGVTVRSTADSLDDLMARPA